MSETDNLDLSEIEYSKLTLDPGQLKQSGILAAAQVTCMDPRIQMSKVYQELEKFGVNSRYAWVIRNAGGRAREALRSIVVSQNFLNTTDIHVIHHTKCGMAGHSEESIRLGLLDAIVNNEPAADKFNKLHQLSQHQFLPIHNQRCVHHSTAEVVRDVELLQNYPLIARKKGGVDIKIHGWLYDVDAKTKTPKLTNALNRPEILSALCDFCECPIGALCECKCQCHPNA
ncbi:hypothetical protein RSOLAG22IIIB_03239 [Rhizoctonia solani]|uniref:Carbonic anhydrase n=1 Tax=Rhizoctonia solani TaxID=456999 RepID=A0A0K6FNG3_9AGAM|nr:hypothetical protein RSOLAG22IIIB_03239 [Rhizoctonia solani]